MYLNAPVPWLRYCISTCDERREQAMKQKQAHLLKGCRDQAKTWALGEHLQAPHCSACTAYCHIQYLPGFPLCTFPACSRRSIAVRMNTVGTIKCMLLGIWMYWLSTQYSRCSSARNTLLGVELLWTNAPVRVSCLYLWQVALIVRLRQWEEPKWEADGVPSSTLWPLFPLFVVGLLPWVWVLLDLAR